MSRKLCMLATALSIALSGLSQDIRFSRADTLRGALSAYRTAFDVHFYELTLKVNPETQYISGSNRIYYIVKEPTEKIQLDLFANLRIDSVVFEHSPVAYTREGAAFFVEFPQRLKADSLYSVEVFYQGRPIEADNPPWDGGFVWAQDSTGSPWIGVACQGLGASAWWPNKDHLSDEPDSMRMIFEVPENLQCVSNGQFKGVHNAQDGYAAYEWFVSYPINNYNVTLNIADYGHFSNRYIGAQGDTLNLEYYVLRRNMEMAKSHFQQVKRMLAAFEKLFGRFPFWNDGYKLVETPYWGMEHQTAIAYGNNYKNNDFGFDFIIVHESAHEYWGNSVSTHDLGQMWIHEAFGTYTEALFLEHTQGYETALAYLNRQKSLIKNKMAIQQPINVNFDEWPDADMYYKGTWMLHTIRNILDDDEAWLNLVRDLYQRFALSIVTAEDITAFIDNRIEENLRPVFDQYLNHIQPPKLIYSMDERKNGVEMNFRWEAGARDFQMPLKLQLPGRDPLWIRPEKDWKSVRLKNLKKEDIALPHDFFYFEAEEE